MNQSADEAEKFTLRTTCGRRSSMSASMSWLRLTKEIAAIEEYSRQ
jgi:hypothetical protein